MQTAKLLAVSAVIVRIQLAVAVYKEPSKFIIASDALTGLIGYLPITPLGTAKGSSGMQTLIPNGTLKNPMGLAVEPVNNLLIVADPSLQQIVGYKLLANDGRLSTGSTITIADQVEARWVVTDSLGNVYFSDERNSKLFKVAAQSVLGGMATPQVIYQSAADSLYAPGGLATDNFNLYWTNKVNGDQNGVLVSAPAVVGASNTQVPSPTALSKNIAKAYGVCLARDNIYYTAPELSVYGMQRNGSQLVELTNSLGDPRGCAWDGENTMYIADRGQNAIFSFVAPQEDLQKVRLLKVAEFNGSFGLAVFSRTMRLEATWILVNLGLGLAVILAVQ